MDKGPTVDVISGMGGIPDVPLDMKTWKHPDNPDGINLRCRTNGCTQRMDEYIAFYNYQDAIDYAQGLIEKYEKLMRFPGNTREQI